MGWAEDVGQWLKDYSGALSALAAIVLVFITAYYARLTNRLAVNANEQLAVAQRQHFDAQMPDVVANASRVSYNPDRNEVGVRVALKNVGPRSADCALHLSEGGSVSEATPEVHIEEMSFEGVVYRPSAYVTLAPGDIVSLEVAFSVDPAVPIAPEPPLTHLQWLSVTVMVSPLGLNAIDDFYWGAVFDPSIPGLENDQPGAFMHEVRRYPWLDRELARRTARDDKPRFRLPWRRKTAAGGTHS